MTHEQPEDLFNAVFECVSAKLIAEQKCEIPDFGTFTVEIEHKVNDLGGVYRCSVIRFRPSFTLYNALLGKEQEDRYAAIELRGDNSERG